MSTDVEADWVCRSQLAPWSRGRYRGRLCGVRGCRRVPATFGVSWWRRCTRPVTWCPRVPPSSAPERGAAPSSTPTWRPSPRSTGFSPRRAGRFRHRPVAGRSHRGHRAPDDPRLDQLGPNSEQAHSVLRTATSYLPDSVAAYMRLPRDFADPRAVSGAKTSLAIFCDQLDLLGSKMDVVFDAACRADADALITDGRFLAEKFCRTRSRSIPRGVDWRRGFGSRRGTPPRSKTTWPPCAGRG